MTSWKEGTKKINREKEMQTKKRRPAEEHPEMGELQKSASRSKVFGIFAQGKYEDKHSMTIPQAFVRFHMCAYV